jgi:hypothetical protein
MVWCSGRLIRGDESISLILSMLDVGTRVSPEVWNPFPMTSRDYSILLL